jgi:hypothetical protein
MYERYVYESGLERKGYRQIGEGFYSAVYAKPRAKTVIKVGQADDAWPLYVAWALRKGYAGKFAPAVKSLKFFKLGSNDAYYVAEMERLRSVNYVSSASKVKEDVTDYKNFTTHLRKPEKLKAKRPEWARFVRDLQKLRKEHRWEVRLDLHGENWMERKDGSLVLTDPFAGRLTGKSTRNAKRAATRLLRAAA